MRARGQESGELINIQDLEVGQVFITILGGPQLTVTQLPVATDDSWSVAVTGGTTPVVLPENYPVQLV
jgi:hypothetical protein